jgi:hypothetical protein
VSESSSGGMAGGEDEGAEEGISPWSPEGYSDDPEGPTTSTEDGD